MASIELDRVNVDFPLYSSRSRGLLNTLMGKAQGHRGRIENIGRRALAVRALRDITLSLKDGDRVGLVGRNGAGKSTMLRVLSSVYEPTSGVMRSSGDISSLIDLMLGMDPDASGYEFVATRCVVMGIGSREAKALVPDIEDFTELGDYLHLPVRTYSSGMMLRLAFAVSTAVAPDILLMDEMIGVGDAQFIDKARIRLENMMSRVKILVLASHSDPILKTFCNQGIWLNEGQICMQGRIDDCLAAYHAS
ncbi:ABC transporter ATP-binding protein [Xylophilus ampelinus]|uniref:ABC-2 type transport system ATP-binding protein/lipopolysaccharide transport system ATP-binding protein n=1 Tax=Xylophilus ampelinus TaxID=54067 RepID=A0A318SIR0_9BURK|nr:ABC transporter ATP-binding protein [Xylophilus ampelinus]MCS4509747.1 ABC transporter ATP-binding protein [Xylophilus ampelinus]PYE78725.1 ABC-2 type transport system ATP-binding protein/lipopolysaccharide transport system ATP-binding protein [Xylophilus ampelinus]